MKQLRSKIEQLSELFKLYESSNKYAGLTLIVETIISSLTSEVFFTKKTMPRNIPIKFLIEPIECNYYPIGTIESIEEK